MRDTEKSVNLQVFRRGRWELTKYLDENRVWNRVRRFYKQSIDKEKVYTRCLSEKDLREELGGFIVDTHLYCYNLWG